jgi:hypothetical protein
MRRFLWLYAFAWFLFVVSAFVCLNVIGTSVKGMHFYGFPRIYATWRPGMNPEWDFFPERVYHDAVIAVVSAMIIAATMTASRVRAGRSPGTMPS